jgi:multimeric flavodoxin WrbA
MKILIVAGSTNQSVNFKQRLEELRKLIEARQWKLTLIDLAEKEIRFCTGCFNCWWKDPGRCIHRDDLDQIYPMILESDLMLFASPLSAGLPSWQIKAFQDRLIPLIHPYIELRQGECHHQKRYKHYPEIALLVEEEADTELADLKILEELYRRFSLNFHSNLKGIASLSQSNEEIYHEICSV